MHEGIQLGISHSRLRGQLVVLGKVEAEQQSAGARRSGFEKIAAINLLCGGFHSAPPAARVAGLPFAVA